MAAQPGPQRVAFVVGNANYLHASKLANPVNDARAIAGQLDRIGFRVLGGGGPAGDDSGAGLDLDRAATWERFEAFCAAIRPGDDALIYYAGHGLQVDDQNYLVPVDADLSSASPLLQLIGLRKMVEMMAQRAGKAGSTVVLLDACRENPFSPADIRKLEQDVRAVGAAGGPAAPFAAVHSGFATFKLRSRDDISPTFICFATAPGEYAYDGPGQHSPFAEAIVRHIGTRGLELDEFMERVGLDVQDRMHEVDKAQDPWHETNMRKDFYFRPVNRRPVWELALGGLLAGLVTCLLLFDDGVRLRSTAEHGWVWLLGGFYALVVAYGTMRWGSRRARDAGVAFLATLLAFAGAMWVLAKVPTELIAENITGAEEIAAWNFSLQAFIDSGRMVVVCLLALMAGILFAAGSMIGCRPQRAIFRGFGPLTGGVTVGLWMALFYLAYRVLMNVYGGPGLGKPLMVVLGALWFAFLAASLGWCFSSYVAEHRRLPSAGPQS